MFDAFFLAGLIVILSKDGKAFLLILSHQPFIGSLVAWDMGNMGNVVNLGSGIIANLIYGFMAIQFLIIGLAPVLYGPAVLRMAVALFKMIRVRSSLNGKKRE